MAETNLPPTTALGMSQVLNVPGRTRGEAEPHVLSPAAGASGKHPHPQENTPHSPSPLAPTAAASSLLSCRAPACATHVTHHPALPLPQYVPRHPQNTSELTSEELLHS